MRTLDQARTQLAPYGWGLTPEGFFQKGETITQVQLKVHKGRFKAYGTSLPAPFLLWSGGDVSEFVKAFWFAQKIN